MHRALCAIMLVIAAAAPCHATERLAGPISATILRVVDGDTLRIEAAIWIGQRITVNVRIRGIDTPELRGRCGREKAMARAARDALSRIAAERHVTLTDIENDKYAGRVVADVETDDGIDLGSHMRAAGLARPYDGGARRGWCDLAGLGD